MFKRGLIPGSIHATSLPLQGIQLHTDLFKIVQKPVWPSISATVKIPLSKENTGVINGKLNEFIRVDTFTVSKGTFKFPAYQKQRFSIVYEPEKSLGQKRTGGNEAHDTISKDSCMVNNTKE